MTATDSSGASNAAASIDITINLQNVNEAPVANGDTVTIDEDTPITIDVLDKDGDPDANDTLTVSGTQRPTHGEATLGPDNTITYTPDLHFDDSDSFTYRVTDMEGLFDEAEVGVVITMVNDTPEFVGVFERRVAIGAAVGTEVGAPIAATDPDGDPLTYEHSGKDATSLLIDGNSGQLTVNAALEATAADAPLVVTVTATDPDMGGGEHRGDHHGYGGHADRRRWRGWRGAAAGAGPLGGGLRMDRDRRHRGLGRRERSADRDLVGRGDRLGRGLGPGPALRLRPQYR